MSARVHQFRNAEDRVRTTLASALNSTLVLYMVLIAVILIGLVLAKG